MRIISNLEDCRLKCFGDFRSDRVRDRRSRSTHPASQQRIQACRREDAAHLSFGASRTSSGMKHCQSENGLCWELVGAIGGRRTAEGRPRGDECGYKKEREAFQGSIFTQAHPAPRSASIESISTSTEFRLAFDRRIGEHGRQLGETTSSMASTCYDLLYSFATV